LPESGLFLGILWGFCHRQGGDGYFSSMCHRAGGNDLGIPDTARGGIRKKESIDWLETLPLPPFDDDIDSRIYGINPSAIRR